MGRKLCFFDIDGTLLDHKNHGKLPESAHKALLELKKNGHIIGIASGKAAHYIKTFIPDIPFDTFVASNGNFVMLEGKLIFKDTFAPDVAQRFIDFCVEHDYAFSIGDIEGTKTLWKNDPHLREYYDGFHMKYPIVVDDLGDVGDIMQMTIAITKEQEKDVLPYFPDMIFARMSDFGMNINPIGGLKEKGIKELLERANLSKDDLVVFGDGLNDIGMFKLSNNSVALGNADPELKKHATYVTDDVGKDGIYNACINLGLINKE